MLAVRLLLGVAAVTATTFPPEINAGLPPHQPGVTVVDYAEYGLPLFEVGGRAMELVHGDHFDAILRDTPDEMRPPSIVAFYASEDEGCMAAYQALNYEHVAETVLPARERLFIAKYDMSSAPHRGWYKWVPERDLARRFGIDWTPSERGNVPKGQARPAAPTKPPTWSISSLLGGKKGAPASKSADCPAIVYAPRSCDGFTEWCVNKEATSPFEKAWVVGCEDFKEHCRVQKWDGKGDWVSWVQAKIAAEEEPKITPFLGSYGETGFWMRERDATTTLNQNRNDWMSMSFPAFTPHGYSVLKIPDPLFERLWAFYHRHKHQLQPEYWPADATQVSFHETPTSIVILDHEHKERDALANTYIRPMVEKWAGLNNLVLTSFFGIREYYEGSVLSMHVDREDTHILSATLSLGRVNSTVLQETRSQPDITPAELARVGKMNNAGSWPLSGVNWKGENVMYEHEPGMVVLYESAKFIHGRPTRNPGGTHLGCFCHFRPPNDMRWNNRTWDEVAEDGRNRMNGMMRHVSYKSTASVEPANPVWTSRIYGERSKWSPKTQAGKAMHAKLKHKDPDPSNGANLAAQEEAPAADGRITVHFVHPDRDKKHEIPRYDIYWADPRTHKDHVHDGEGSSNEEDEDSDEVLTKGGVLQGSVAPGEKLQVETYEGHRFFWLEQQRSAKRRVELGQKVKVKGKEEENSKRKRYYTTIFGVRAKKDNEYVFGVHHDDL